MAHQYYCLILHDSPTAITVFESPDLYIDRSNPGLIYGDIDDIPCYAQLDLRRYIYGELALSKLPPISAIDNPPLLLLGNVPDSPLLSFTTGYRRNMMIYLQRLFWLIGHMHRFGDFNTMSTMDFLEELVHAEAYTQKLLQQVGDLPPLPHPYIHPNTELDTIGR